MQGVVGRIFQPDPSREDFRFGFQGVELGRI